MVTKITDIKSYAAHVRMHNRTLHGTLQGLHVVMG